MLFNDDSFTLDVLSEVVLFLDGELLHEVGQQYNGSDWPRCIGRDERSNERVNLRLAQIL